MATSESISFAPAHVPADLVWDHSLAEFNGELDDPFHAAARLLDGPPLFYARDAVHQRPGWVIARHSLLKEAFIDWEHFSSEGGMDLSLMLGVDWNLNPVNIDPPMHTIYRKVLTPFFTPKAVNHMEEGVHQTCDDLISKFEDKDGCDFVKDFAVPFPSLIFLRLMGLPLGLMEQFFGFEQGLLRGHTFEERVIAARSILACLTEHLEHQRAKPTTPLMDSIINARIEDGRPLNDGEILGMLYTFYVGGLDTVYGTLGWSMRHIATHPDLQQFLRDNPDKMDKVVMEMLRMFSVVSSQRRVTKDFEWHGVQMKENDLVVMPIFIACRDPEAYPEPHEFKLGRDEQPLAFASGPHLCLGMHLARRELKIAIQSFLDKFDNIHIPEGTAYAFHAGSTFNVDSLPIVWTCKASPTCSE
ncbi:cytochrome P450 [Novosphingobium album (ex Hu et al. 2023)]|uniref:Cytochrome P450 n=1 Tax=Novosphingobium album (ex Hu et al. 2023) TaxID=2930093 RepID=A0ABT0B5Q7_9SPHN|nr:cytochrome P450 [Novosphingobium album (ex Hu et al. 2023)]MCJ2180210.1 cytochrome P450 [Novosphingobium album (ex Hu et al. 2023)]